MVYYYFGSKEGLFQAVVSKKVTMRGFIERLESLLETKASPEARLREFVRSYLSAFPHDAVNVGLYIRDSSELEEKSSKRLVSDLDQVRSIARGLIADAIASGEFRRTDPSKATDCLLGMMNRFVFQRVHFRRRFDPDEIADYISDFFRRAMMPLHAK